MAINSIAFSGIRAEMGRRNLTIGDVADLVGVSRSALSRKLSMQSSISLEEAFDIKRKVFPDKDLLYLFSELAC